MNPAKKTVFDRRVEDAQHAPVLLQQVGLHALAMQHCLRAAVAFRRARALVQRGGARVLCSCTLGELVRRVRFGRALVLFVVVVSGDGVCVWITFVGALWLSVGIVNDFALGEVKQLLLFGRLLGWVLHGLHLVIALVHHVSIIFLKSFKFLLIRIYP